MEACFAESSARGLFALPRCSNAALASVPWVFDPGGISPPRKIVPRGTGAWRRGRAPRSVEPLLSAGVSFVVHSSVTQSPGQPLISVEFDAGLLIMMIAFP